MATHRRSRTLEVNGPHPPPPRPQAQAASSGDRSAARTITCVTPPSTAVCSSTPSHASAGLGLRDGTAIVPLGDSDQVGCNRNNDRSSATPDSDGPLLARYLLIGDPESSPHAVRALESFGSETALCSHAFSGIERATVTPCALMHSVSCAAVGPGEPVFVCSGCGEQAPGFAHPVLAPAGLTGRSWPLAVSGGDGESGRCHQAGQRDRHRVFAAWLLLLSIEWVNPHLSSATREIGPCWSEESIAKP
jgi:hypothetical protein